MTNMRIARLRPGFSPDVYCEVTLPPYSLDKLRKELVAVQTLEPSERWRLETRGTHRDWHVWED